MCARYGTTMTMREAMQRLGVDFGRLLGEGNGPSYNIAPGTEQCTAISHTGHQATIELTNTHWGFRPSWQNQPAKSSINMRIESSRKRYWHKAFCKRRCVVPANWWYEWKLEGAVKQPYTIRPVDTDGFFFAGVWSVAKGLPEDHPLHGRRTFAILTRPALAQIEPIHPRMPVALDDATARSWLEPEMTHDQLRDIAANTALREVRAWSVSTRVNKPENNDPSLLDPVG